MSISERVVIHPEAKTPLKRTWEMGLNTCHAPIVMRSDVQEQMVRARKELGMQYWRCHGFLSDDVGVVVSDHQDRVIGYAFSGLKRIIDCALGIGYTPFFELDFTPRALAQDPTQTITDYRAI